MEESQIPRVAEVILKRRKSQDVSRARSAAANVKSKKRAKLAYKLSFNRAEKLIKQVRVKRSYELRLARQAKRPQKKSTLPLEKKLIIAIRITRGPSLHDKPKEALRLLRLSKVNAAAFLIQNRTTVELLKLAEPYVVWGFPSTKLVRDLIWKRGYGKVDGKRVALNNVLIEENLGNLGIICMEDLLYEIVNMTKNFKTVNTFLWNFHLSSPSVGVNKKKAFGPRGDLINSLLKRII